MPAQSLKGDREMNELERRDLEVAKATLRIVDLVNKGYTVIDVFGVEDIMSVFETYTLAYINRVMESY